MLYSKGGNVRVRHEMSEMLSRFRPDLSPILCGWVW